MPIMFKIELTDTFGGELNYTWVKRFTVKAKTMQGAICKLSRETGYAFRKNFGDDSGARYDAKNACIAAWAEWNDDGKPHGQTL